MDGIRRVFAIVFLVSGVICTPVSAADLPPEFYKLLNRWDSMIEEVRSADLRVHKLWWRPESAETVPTRAEFRSFVEKEIVPQVGMTGALDGLQRASNELCNKRGLPRMLWVTYDILQDVDATRNDLIIPPPAVGAGREILVSDVLGQVEYVEVNSFASVSSPALKRPLERLQSFRLVPGTSGFKSLPPDAVSISDDGVMHIESKGVFEVEPATGIVRHYEHKSKKWVQEIFQLLPRQISGITIPGVRADLTYKTTDTGVERLSEAQIFVLESARLNEEIAKERFAVPVPAGTTVALRTDLVSRHEVTRTTAAVPDVGAYARGNR